MTYLIILELGVGEHLFCSVLLYNYIFYILYMALFSI